MGRSLRELPVELLNHVLKNLSLADLLSFARTSRTSYDLSVQALTSLDLAIFPRKIHCLLAFFDASFETEDDDDKELDGDEYLLGSSLESSFAPHPRSRIALYQIGLTTPGSRQRQFVGGSRARELKHFRSGHDSQGKDQSLSQTPPTALALRTAEIASQNSRATSVLSASSLSNLRSLTLRLYDFTCPNLAMTIATSFPRLQALMLDFSHPYIHDTVLPARSWHETVPTGSPIWNILSGVGESHETTLRLRNLCSLRLNRSGITSFQLRHWIQANPELRELRLSLCRGVDAEFVTWLGQYVASGRSKLEVIQLTQCDLLELQRKNDFAWITAAAESNKLRELSLFRCKRVNDDVFLRFTGCRENDRSGGLSIPNVGPSSWTSESDDDESDAGDGSDQTLNSWSGIRKLVSPKGVIVSTAIAGEKLQKSCQYQNARSKTYIQTRATRRRSVSPALTVSDCMMGGVGGSSSSKESGSDHNGASDSSNSAGSRQCYFGRSGVTDPALTSL